MGKPMCLGTGVFKLIHKQANKTEPVMRKTIFENIL